MARSVKPGLAHDEDIRVATHCEFVFVCAVFLVPAEPREGKGQLDHLAPQTRQRKTVQVRRASRRQQQEHQQAAGAREAPERASVAEKACADRTLSNVCMYVCMTHTHTHTHTHMHTGDTLPCSDACARDAVSSLRCSSPVPALLEAACAQAACSET